MSNYKNTPAITERYHIEVPLNEYYSGYCVYKVWFGKKFYIGKGKSLMQSVQNMANIIERALRLRNYDASDMYYKVIVWINKDSIINAQVEVVGGDGLSEFELLKLEQETLDKNKNNPNCLNNNFDAYLPKWISELEAQKFLQWKGISKDKIIQRIEKKKKEDLFGIEYFNEADKNKRGVYKLFFGEKFYIGRAKLIYNRMGMHKRAIKQRLTGYKQVTELDFYKKIMQVIKDSDLKLATCVLLKECVTVDELVAEEQKELNKAKKNRNCLNIGFTAKRMSNEKDDTVEDTIKKPLFFTKGGKRYYISRKVK